LKDPTLSKTAKSYGDWLGFLQRSGGIAPVFTPLARATGNQVRAWVLEMRDAGNRATTMIGRMADLLRAFKILCPGERLERLEETVAILSAALRPQAVPRSINVPDARVLYDWGIRLMNEGFTLTDGKPAALAYRDGLIIALLATRARRLRAMAGLRMNLEIKATTLGWCFDLPPTLVKNEKPDAVKLPDALTPYIDHYVQVVRPCLLGGTVTEGFWVVGPARTLSEKGLQAMVLRRTKAEYGIAFGPHRFRHALTTTVLLNAPDDPSLAASVLRHSRRVNDEHYDHGGQIEAVSRLTLLVRRGKN
jgi:site-specific recombinase XerD